MHGWREPSPEIRRDFTCHLFDVYMEELMGHRSVCAVG